MRQINRVRPLLPAHAMKSYRIVIPERSIGEATCDEVDCRAMQFGWRTIVDEATDLGQRQAHYIRTLSRRAFVEDRSVEGLTQFVFAPGQECFAQHKRRVDDREVYAVVGGDWRGNPRQEIRVHQGAEDWTDDFRTHQDRLIERQNQG